MLTTNFVVSETWFTVTIQAPAIVTVRTVPFGRQLAFFRTCSENVWLRSGTLWTCSLSLKAVDIEWSGHQDNERGNHLLHVYTSISYGVQFQQKMVWLSFSPPDPIYLIGARNVSQLSPLRVASFWLLHFRVRRLFDITHEEWESVALLVKNSSPECFFSLQAIFHRKYLSRFPLQPWTDILYSLFSLCNLWQQISTRAVLCISDSVISCKGSSSEFWMLCRVSGL